MTTNTRTAAAEGGEDRSGARPGIEARGTRVVQTRHNDAGRGTMILRNTDGTGFSLSYSAPLFRGPMVQTFRTLDAAYVAADVFMSGRSLIVAMNAGAEQDRMTLAYQAVQS